MTQDPNADQTEFWNGQPGENWARLQPDLDALMQPVLGLLMRHAAVRPGESVLDIGCGAGASTLAAARAAGPAGQAYGVDLSEPLLRRAEERQRAEGPATAAFARADAQDDPLPAARFDLALSRFGTMFFSDPVAAFRNIGAALRPGGRLVLACWAGPELNPWFTLPHQAAVRQLGPVDPTPPDAPGPMAFSNIDRVCGILRDAGLAACRGTLEQIDLHHPGGLEAAVRLAGNVGPIARILRDRNGTEADRRAIDAAITADFEKYRSADGIRIPAGINIFSAERA